MRLHSSSEFGGQEDVRPIGRVVHVHQDPAQAVHHVGGVVRVHAPHKAGSVVVARQGLLGLGLALVAGEGDHGAGLRARLPVGVG